MANIITAQTGGREFNKPDITKYSLFVGGVNATSHALRNYSPLMNGFGRLFMVRVPKVIAMYYGGGTSGNMYSSDSRFVQFRHMMEYMNRSVTGFGTKDLEIASTPIMGGFAGRQFKTPTVTKEKTETIQISLFEMIGCPIYDVIDTWMNSIGDENSGYATYMGLIAGGYDETGNPIRLYQRDGDDADGIEFNEANHTAEFIYCLTDRSGGMVERAVMLADCFPLGIQQSNVLDYTGGTHDNVYYDIQFNCTVYRSPIITSIANDLLKQYRIVTNSLNFNPELGDAVYAANDVTTLNQSMPSVPVDSATGTDIGNAPVFYVKDTSFITPAKDPGIVAGKLAGQEDG